MAKRLSWTVALMVILGCAAAGPTPLGADSGKDGVAAQRERAIRAALDLLPRRPSRIAVIDPNDAKPDARQTLLNSDAFITRGGRVVYLTSHSEVLKGAETGSRLFVHMLASIIWHEMAHIDGADEREAQRREEGLWTRFVRDRQVDEVTALRYLKLLKGRHRD